MSVRGRPCLVLSLTAALAVAGCAGGQPRDAATTTTATTPDGATATGGSASLTRAPSERRAFDPASPLTLDASVELALASSLNARTFKARLDAARGAAQAASAWPNPTIEYTGEDFGLVFQHQRQLLSQEVVGYPILAFWTKFLEQDVADAELARATASVEEDKRQLRLTVGQTFLELLASEEAVHNLLESAAIANKLAVATAKRTKLGDASALDTRRAETEALEVRRDLATAMLKRETDGIAFALALGAEKPTPVTLAPGWPLELPGDVAAADSSSAGALVEGAFAARADLREAEASLLRANKAAELEGRRTLPFSTWTLAVGARQGPQGYGGVLVAGTTIPLFDWNSGNRTRAAAELEQAVADLERARRQVAFDVEAALVTYQRARSSLEEFARPIARSREDSLEASRRLFAAGEVGYLDLLQSQRDALVARRDLTDSEKETALARWKLVVALGR